MKRYSSAVEGGVFVDETLSFLVDDVLDEGAGLNDGVAIRRACFDNPVVKYSEKKKQIIQKVVVLAIYLHLSLVFVIHY